MCKSRFQALTIADTAVVWTAYIFLLLICAVLTFGGVIELSFDTHDQAYMLDFFPRRSIIATVIREAHAWEADI
tara:strand:- start:96 stop:317 length:222 start_codon:yes stop_codon:yes gene_type:complete